MCRQPSYRPLSLNWNHKLLPRHASVRFCVCGHVCVCVWMEHKMAPCFPSHPKCSQWCQYNYDRHNLFQFHLPSVLLLFCVSPRVQHMTGHLFVHNIILLFSSIHSLPCFIKIIPRHASQRRPRLSLSAC